MENTLTIPVCVHLTLLLTQDKLGVVNVIVFSYIVNSIVKCISI